MKKTTGPYPALTVDGGGSSVVPHAGATLLLRTAQTVGLPAELSDALGPWRRPLAVHDPAKVVLDLAVSLAIGGDCLARVPQLSAVSGDGLWCLCWSWSRQSGTMGNRLVTEPVVHTLTASGNIPSLW